MTGGLQEQITDGKDWFGIGLNPSSKAIIGSQEVPYIYEDRLSKSQFLSALSKIYFMSAESRKEMGMKGRNHVLQNYSFEKFNKQWVELMDSIIEKHGSWQNRSQYNGVYFGEVA
jgi:Tfp pilus assembly PilM family ATPase